MKNAIIIFFVFIFLTPISQSQIVDKKLDYVSDFTDCGITYHIIADFNVNNSDIFITLYPRTNGEEIMTQCSAWEIMCLIQSLENAKNIYTEWQTKANDLSIKMFSKRLPRFRFGENPGVSFRDMDIYFKINDNWYFENNADVWATFYVNNDGKCFLIVETDYISDAELVSESSNSSFIFGGGTNTIGRGIFSGHTKTEIKRRSEGATITFSSIEKIDQFISILKETIEWNNKKTNSEKLFR